MKMKYSFSLNTKMQMLFLRKKKHEINFILLLLKILNTKILLKNFVFII